MAKFSSTLIEQASGKLGDNIVMRQTATGKILCKAPKKASTPRRSEKQANTRLQMANLLANYRLYSGKLAEAFESKRAGLSDANMFVSSNWGHAPVYLTRQMRIQGACVLADDLFSIGSIEPIGYGLNSAGKLVTNLNLGIEIGAGTTVAQFSGALMTANDNWREGDQLTFFVGTQYAGVDGMPRANMRAQKVVLSLDDQTKLWDVVTSEGFSTVDGYLATGMVLSEMGCAWVHSRENSGQTKVSTQRLVVVSEVLGQYQTYEAMKAAADSYGGINKSAVYLNPQSSLNEYVGSVSQGGTTGGGSSNAGNNGGTGNGGSSQNGGTTGGNTGGGDNTGGNTGGNTGSVEPSVPKLTINRTGTGTSSVTVNGSAVSSGAEVAAGTEVSVSVTPAEGAVPTATMNGSSVSLTENEGVYTGSFSMPSGNATLAINSGGASGGGSGDID